LSRFFKRARETTSLAVSYLDNSNPGIH